MDALTAPEMEAIVQRLETLITDLEHDLRAEPFYRFVLLADEWARAKKTDYSLALLRRCLLLAQRMLPIRAQAVEASVRWAPLHKVSELIHGEAHRLSTLYGVVRPASITIRRTLQQAFRTTFAQATGEAYEKYRFSRTAKARTTITRFWEEALHTALAQWQAQGTVEALDEVIACLPLWADRDHERWGSRHTWREPSAQEVLALFTAYLQICETCLGTITALAQDAVAEAPVVERAQVAPDVEAQYAAQIQDLRAQLSALPLPKDIPKAQQAPLRKAKTQLTQALQGLLKAQDAEIARRVQRHANARHKLDTLVKTTQGYQETVLRKVGKLSIDVLQDIIWIYEWDREGDDTWRAAKREAKRFVRQVRQTSGPPMAVEAS